MKTLGQFIGGMLFTALLIGIGSVAVIWISYLVHVGWASK